MSLLKVNKIQDTTGDDALTFDSSGNTTVNQTLTTTSANITTGGTNNLTISDGNLVIGTSGHGIDFSATSGSGTSEVFTDYEEGTFTPTMSAGYTSPGYHSDTGGWYTKVGNTVYARIYMRLNAGTGNSDQVTIDGLPFTHAGAFYAAACGYIPAGDLGAGVLPQLVLMPSTTNLKLYFYSNQTTIGTRSGSSLNANCELIYWITYKVA